LAEIRFIEIDLPHFFARSQLKIKAVLWIRIIPKGNHPDEDRFFCVKGKEKL